MFGENNAIVDEADEFNTWSESDFRRKDIENDMQT